MTRRHIICGIIVFQLLSILALSGCKTDEKAIIEYQELINNSSGAIDLLLSELSYKKIIFIGENHMWTNEEEFLADALPDFYEAGVRYLFLEGDIPDYAVPGYENYLFPMFYPWIGANWKFENTMVIQKINEFNSFLPETDRIKIITPETGRRDVDTSDPSKSADFINYRDAYAADNIIKIMNGASRNDKGLVLYGYDHGAVRKKRTRTGNYSYVRIPLGYLLKSYYGDMFGSYRFFAVDEYFGSVYNNIDKLREISSTIVLSKDIKYTNIFSKKNEVDGIIVVPELHYGTYYQYVPINENLEYLLKIIKEYEEWLDNNYQKDEKFITTDPQAQYLMAIYYLKMYYGNDFEYNFWHKTDEWELPLVEAIKKLEENFFYDGNPAEHIKFSYSPDQIRLYSKYMFYSNIEGLLELKNEFRKSEDVIRYCREAQTTFPEDIWPLYWIAYTQAKLERYAEALISFEKLFAHNLSYCMETLPLAYEHAAICAKQMNNEELYRYYNSMATGLHNEHNIDVAGYYYTGHLYDGSF